MDLQPSTPLRPEDSARAPLSPKTDRASRVHELLSTPMRANPLFRQAQDTTGDLVFIQTVLQHLRHPHCRFKMEMGHDGHLKFTPVLRPWWERLFSFIFVRGKESQEAAQSLIARLSSIAQHAGLPKKAEVLHETGRVLEQLQKNRWFKELCESNKEVHHKTQEIQNLALKTLEEHWKQYLVGFLDQKKNALLSSVAEKNYEKALTIFKELQEAKAHLASDIMHCPKELAKKIAQAYLEIEQEFIQVLMKDEALRSQFFQNKDNLRLLSLQGRAFLFQQLEEEHGPHKKEIQKALRISNLQDAIQCAVDPECFYVQQCCVDCQGTLPLTYLTGMQHVRENFPVGLLAISHDVSEIASAFHRLSESLYPALSVERQRSFAELLQQTAQTFGRSAFVSKEASQSFQEALMRIEIPQTILNREGGPNASKFPPVTIPLEIYQRDNSALEVVQQLTQEAEHHFCEMDPLFLVGKDLSKILQNRRDLLLDQKQVNEKLKVLRNKQQVDPKTLSPDDEKLLVTLPIRAQTIVDQLQKLEQKIKETPALASAQELDARNNEIYDRMTRDLMPTEPMAPLSTKDLGKKLSWWIQVAHQATSQNNFHVGWEIMAAVEALVPSLVRLLEKQQNLKLDLASILPSKTFRLYEHLQKFYSPQRNYHNIRAQISLLENQKKTWVLPLNLLLKFKETLRDDDGAIHPEEMVRLTETFYQFIGHLQRDNLSSGESSVSVD